MAHKDGSDVLLTRKEFDHLHALATAFMTQQAYTQAVASLASFGDTKDSIRLLHSLHEEVGQ